MIDLSEIVALLPLAMGGFIISYFVLRLKRKDIGIRSNIEFIIVMIGAPLLGHLCGRLFAWFEGYLVGVTHYNMRFHGLIFIPPWIYLVLCPKVKYNTAHFFDAVTLMTVPALLISRINCIVAGCDQGRHIPGTVLRFPTREVEIIFCAILTVYLLKMNKRGDRVGQLFPVFMTAYGIFRFLWEGFYEVDKLLLGVHPAHIWSVITFIAGGSVLFEMRAQAEKNIKAKHRRS